MDQDHYDVLGISRDADEEEIKAAFRERIKQVHSDQGGNTEAAKRVIDARDYLLKTNSTEGQETSSQNNGQGDNRRKASTSQEDKQTNRSKNDTGAGSASTGSSTGGASTTDTDSSTDSRSDSWTDYEDEYWQDEADRQPGGASRSQTGRTSTSAGTSGWESPGAGSESGRSSTSDTAGSTQSSSTSTGPGSADAEGTTTSAGSGQDTISWADVRSAATGDYPRFEGFRGFAAGHMIQLVSGVFESFAIGLVAVFMVGVWYTVGIVGFTCAVVLAWVLDVVNPIFVLLTSSSPGSGPAPGEALVRNLMVVLPLAIALLAGGFAELMFAGGAYDGSTSDKKDAKLRSMPFALSVALVPGIPLAVILAAHYLPSSVPYSLPPSAGLVGLFLVSALHYRLKYVFDIFARAIYSSPVVGALCGGAVISAWWITILDAVNARFRALGVPYVEGNVVNASVAFAGRVDRIVYLPDELAQLTNPYDVIAAVLLVTAAHFGYVALILGVKRARRAARFVTGGSSEP